MRAQRLVPCEEVHSRRLARGRVAGAARRASPDAAGRPARGRGAAARRRDERERGRRAKSRLLAVARARAEADGFRVLAARGNELECELPFSVVRELLEPVLAAAAKANVA